MPQYGYTGREPDESGLVYYRARYYDPQVGRFTQRDPLGMVDGFNVYGYAAGNPVLFVDPMGMTIRFASAGSNNSYFGNTLTDVQTEAYDFSNGPVNVVGGARNGGGGSRNGNFRTEPTIENIFSQSRINQVESQIQAYRPGYRYSEIGGSGPTAASVRNVEQVLRSEQSIFQTRIDTLTSAMSSRTQNSMTIAITRAQNPEHRTGG